MAAKGTKVTQKEVERMVNLYAEYGTYTKVAKKMRRNPDTVAKYLQQYEISKLTKEALLKQGITKAQFLSIFE